MFLVVEKKHYGRYIALATFLVLIMFVSTSYSYFDRRVDSYSMTSGDVTLYVEGGLSFSKEGDIDLTLSRDNFGEGAGNLTDSMIAKATLTAGTGETNVSGFYNIYLNIAKNSFKYTTEEHVPELLLFIKNPEGEYLNAIDGLELEETLHGFDITEKSGLIEIATNKMISTGDADQKIDNWEFELVFINLDSNQSINEGKSIEIRAILQKEAFAYPTLAPGNTWYSEISSQASSITNINLVDSYLPTGTEKKTWDCSAGASKLVTCYLDSTQTTITIAGNGTGNIYANADSSNAFSFANLEMIDGLDMLNTSKVTNMSRMFYESGSGSAFDLGDISNWDTSNVIDMSEMFKNAGTGTRTFRIDISNWNMSKVDNINEMFEGSGSSALIWYVLIPPTNSNRVNNSTTRIHGKNSNTHYNLTDRSFTIAEY